MASTIPSTPTASGTASAASHPVTVPTHTTGDLLLSRVLYTQTTGSVTGPDDNDGWTLLQSTKDATVTQISELYGKIATSSSEAITSISTNSGTTSSYWCLAVRGHGFASISEVAAYTAKTTATGTTTPDPTSVTGFATSDMAIVDVAYASAGAVTITGWPSGYTDNRTQYVQSSSTGIGVASKSGTITDPENPGTFTLSGSKPYSAITIVIKASASTSVAPLAAAYYYT